MSASEGEIALTLRLMHDHLAGLAELASSLAEAISAPPPPLRLLSLDEAAAATGIPRRTLNEMVLDHRLPATNLGRGRGRSRWFIKQTDLTQLTDQPGATR